VDALDGLSITSPTNLAVKRVYENPPGTIQDWPAFIIYPPSMDATVGPGSRWRDYRVRLLMIISDQDMSQAAAIADAFREVLIPAFDAKVSLSGNATQCYIVGCETVGYFGIGEKVLIGFNSSLRVEVKETVAFS